MIRKLLFILAFLTSSAYAADHYVAANGDDNGTGSIGDPWKTLAKVKTMLSLANIQPGDHIKFRAGDVFYGSLDMMKSGAPGNPIVFETYGVGPQAKISGFVNLTGWISVGTNLWEPTTTLTNTYLNMVTVGGNIQDKGRYPNSDQPHNGYLFYTDYTDISATTFPDSYTGTIETPSLSSDTNWTGAEIYVRKWAWILDRGSINSHSGGTINYTTPEFRDGPGSSNYGYFITNDPRTLNRQGEWWYNKATGKVRMYSVGAPTGVRASNVEVLAQVSGYSYITFDNLAFEGADSIAIHLNSTNGVRITRCSIEFTGRDHIKGGASSNLLIQYDTLRNCNNNGIDLDWGGNGIQILDNKISRCGLIAGLGSNNNAMTSGMYVRSLNLTVARNRIDSVGYEGIVWNGTNALVENNVVNYYSTLKSDGGAFYTWSFLDNMGQPLLNRMCRGNFAINGIGEHEGTKTRPDHGANAFYSDDLSRGVTFINNTAANVMGAGMLLHNADTMKVIGNIYYSTQQAIIVLGDDLHPERVMRGDSIYDNNIIRLNPTQKSFSIASFYDDLEELGYINANHYFGQGVAFHTGEAEYQNLQGWRANFGYDSLGTYDPLIVKPFVITSSGAFNTISSTSYSFASNVFFPDMDAGPMTAGQQYRIRFNISSTNGTRSVRTELWRWGNMTYPQNQQFLPFGWERVTEIGPTTTPVDFIYEAQVTEPSMHIVFTRSGAPGTWTVTGLSVQAVTADEVNIEDSIRIITNPAPSRLTSQFNATMLDVQNNRQEGGVYVAPYRAAVLQRVGAKPVRPVIKGRLITTQ